MRIARTTITVRGILFCVAVIAAYLAGVVSQRSQIEGKLKELDSLRTELALESEQAALVQMIEHVRVSNPGDLDRIEKLLDQLDAYEARSLDSANPACPEMGP